MQKYLDMLEKNVQWIALGLGGIFLLWMVYANIVEPPVYVQIGNQKLTAGEIADYTLKGPVHTLQTQMDSKEVPPLPRLDAVAQFTGQLQETPKLALAEAWPWNGVTSTVVKGNVTGTPENVQTPQIAGLPTLPAAVPVQATAGMSTVSMELPQRQQNGPETRPARAARVPRGGAQAQPVAKQDDLLWASYFFKIPADDLQKAFEKVLNGQQPENIELFNTWVLKVEVQRQEEITPGTWGNDFAVKPLHIYQMKNIPADTVSQNEKYAFREWAVENQEDIVRPQFYPTVFGTEWLTPEQQEARDAAQQPGAAPPGRSGVAPGAEERGMRERYLRRVPGRSGRSYLLADPDRPEGAYSDPRMPYRGGYGGYRGGRMPYRGGFPQSGFQQPWQQFNPGAQGQGAINPLDLPDDVQVWGHDENVQGGKTYRYQIRYYLYNPVYAISNVTKDPKDAQKLWIRSDWSDWTKPVKVPENVRFFLVAANPPSKAMFDVFRWSKGNWKKDQVRGAPGDNVGPEWTVVDVRRDPRSGSYVMLLNNKTEQLTRRDPQTDTGNPDYQNLKNEVEQPAEAATDQGPISPAVRDRSYGGAYGRPSYGRPR